MPSIWENLYKLLKKEPFLSSRSGGEEKKKEEKRLLTRCTHPDIYRKKHSREYFSFVYKPEKGKETKKEHALVRSPFYNPPIPSIWFSCNLRPGRKKSVIYLFFVC